MTEIATYINEIERLKSGRKYNDALKLIEKQLVKNNNDYRLYEEYADICIYTKDLEKAENAVRFALELHPESATGLYLLGYILLTKGDFANGVDILEKSNTFFPNNPEVLRNLGWGYHMLGDPRGIILLKRALNLSPEDEFIIEDLGMALISTGNKKEGLEYMKKIGKDGSGRRMSIKK